ncbi:MAG TPA: pyruvate kinase [Spongiibacteraceae bacterium]|jgi:pyruvate kinase|nr:pyruvate kinase [Spongiibacteraceae bacterium]HUH37050.1 pyruvate kinase [Spongiibacteraceae bacterium]
MRKTKIICTIGPATESFDMLEKLAKAGMDVVRLNMSHGDHASHARIIKAVHTLNRKLPYPIPILLDTQGPEIRTGDLSEDVHLETGSVVSVSVRSGMDVEETSFQIHYEDLLDTVGIGDRITVDNGLINLEVLSKSERSLECRVVDGGLLKSKRHVNLPGIRVNLPAITAKDKRDILFGVEQEVDFIALSFVRDAEDVRELRRLLGNKADKIKIIAKIEDQEGLRNLEAIIDEADGAMVARGDLGVEIPVEILPNAQRRIVRLCAERGKRSIVATHLLESMITNPIPTRAEVTDVANAVYEEVDAIMLSGETTIGKYPIRCVEYLDRIARESEKGVGLRLSNGLIAENDKQHIAGSAVHLAELIDARGIVVVTRRGRTANYVANCRPPKSAIYAFTNDSRTRRQMNLVRSVMAYRIDFHQDPELTLAAAFEQLRKKAGLKTGDKVVVISDTLAGAGIEAIQVRQLP